MFLFIKDKPLAEYTLEGLRKGYNYPKFHIQEAIDYYEYLEEYEICAELLKLKECNKQHILGNIPPV